MFVEIKNILPKFSHTGEPLVVDSKHDFLEVSYINRYPTGKLKLKRFQPKKALVKKIVEISDNLIMAMGLYFGDGQTAVTSKSYQAVRFANYNSDTILRFLSALDGLGIKRNELVVGLNISITLAKKDNLKFREKIVNYWSKLTRIPRSNFYKVNWLKNLSTKAPKGNITLIHANSSFRLIFDSLYKYIKNLATKNRDVAALFLSGVIAADGCVYVPTREVLISAKEEGARAYLRSLLGLLEIEPNKDGLVEGKEMVRITGYSNMQLIKSHKLCEIHSEKREKFDRLFHSYKLFAYRKGKGAPFLMSLLSKPMTVYQLSQRFNRKENAVRRYLYILEKSGLAHRYNTLKTARTGRYAELWQTNQQD